jgi:exonuclease III
MAFRKKARYILAYKPDILVVQECEHPDKLKWDKDLPQPTDVLWYGANPHKGLAVFSYGSYRFKLLKNHNPDIKLILPIAVTGGATDFTLFAVWAYNPDDKEYNYVGQVWKAVQHYKKLLKKGLVLMAGDFNSNTIWDKPKREANHSTVVKLLKDMDIYSTYHEHLLQVQGQEAHPTFFLYRHKDKPYHMDYCFASGGFMQQLASVEVGKFADWRAYSDHKPLIVTFNT